MPNWCSNSLTVTGPDAGAFVARLNPADDTGKIPGLLSTFVPMPEELRNYTSPVRAENGEDDAAFVARLEHCQAAYGATDWFDWACGHWGTKWDTEAEASSQAAWTFETAWSPPVEWLGAVSAMFPDAEFTLAYCEAGVETAGVLKVRAGEPESETEYVGPWSAPVDDDEDDWVMSAELQAFVAEHGLNGTGG